MGEAGRDRKTPSQTRAEGEGRETSHKTPVEKRAHVMSLPVLSEKLYLYSRFLGLLEEKNFATITELKEFLVENVHRLKNLHEDVYRHE